MKNCHMFNLKLVTSLPKKFQRVLSHGSQLGGKKHLWFLSSLTSLKGDCQFYRDARALLWLHRIEAWNVMKVTRLETLFISVNKQFIKTKLKS